MTVWTVNALYDPEAQVWVAYDSDVPGLVTEGETIAKLEAKLDALVPEMVELNADYIPADRREGPHSFRLIAHYESDQILAA